MSNYIDSIQLSGTVYTLSAETSGITVSSAITEGDTNAVQGGAVFDKIAIATHIPSSGVVLTFDEDYYSTNYPAYTNRLVCDFSGADYVFTTVGFYDSDKERIDGIGVEVGYGDGEFWDIVANGCSATTAGTVLTIEFENNDIAYLHNGDSDKITTVAYGPDTVWLIDSLNSRIDSLNETKQDKLTEGRGITIDTGNTISVSLPISAGTGNYSIAEGVGTQASGFRSHAEGWGTIASGNTSHAEGGSTTARGSFSHAEGYNTTARGEYSHAEGGDTTANGHYSHVEGEGTTANGDYSHAEGFYTITNNESEHASGQYNVSSSASTTFGNSGNTLFSVGNGASSSARHNAFEIRQNGDIYLSSGGTDIKLQDHLGGGGGNPTVELTQAEYDALVSAGTVASDTYYIITDAQSPDISQYWTSAQTQSAITAAVSGKVDTSAITSSVTSASTDNEIPTAKAVFDAIPTGGTGGSYSAGRGIDITNDTISFSLPISAGTGSNSIRENYQTFANGIQCHAEGGGNTTAQGQATHAEGYGTNASATASHAEGWFTKTTADFSHAEGNYTSALTIASHAEGSYTIANNQSEHASGQYNNSVSASTTFGNSGNTLFSVGNGTADNARHNAFEIRQNGDIYLTKDGVDIKLQDNLGGGGGGIDSGTVQTMIDESISGKQDTLSAGTNIAINSSTNTISCSIPITVSPTNMVLSGASNTIGDNVSFSTIFGSFNKIKGGSSAYSFQNNFIFGYNDTISATSVSSYNAGFNVGFGSNNTISGANIANSFICGLNNVVNNSYGSAFGYYNNSVTGSTNADRTLFSVGNGTANARHNAFEIRQNGDIYLSLNGQDVKLQDQLGGGSITIDPTLDSGSTNPVANSAITTALDAKQDTLVSGTNIKTINNQSILGSGNIDIQGSVTVDQTIISGSTNPVAGGAVYDALGDIEALLASI